MTIKPINWNAIEDDVDKEVWDKLTSNFWLPEKIPLSGDISQWKKMTKQEQDTLARVFAGLTLLDTVQGTLGATSMIPDSLTMHEEAVLSYVTFNEAVHAKSYSTIFSTLLTTPEINEAFDWSEENKFLQYKADKIVSFYNEDDPVKKKIASVILESFLFYSGFYYIFHLASRGLLINSANIIQLILRDEAVHGYYLGYKSQKLQEIGQYTKEMRESYADFAYDLVFDLMENELKYTHELYDELGLSSEVESFLKYNANKALMNLGYDAIYPKDESTPPPEIMASLDPTSNANHDFFSSSGSSYVVVGNEETTDDDWDF